MADDGKKGKTNVKAKHTIFFFDRVYSRLSKITNALNDMFRYFIFILKSVSAHEKRR